ncbi:MAG: D-alanyl-D-alanine carboxypeptidase [Epulopiscium sp.]|nr:D-alanyl-D-alanine carboxypeptidase [Candidatus Epulonipiscium sp.]
MKSIGRLFMSIFLIFMMNITIFAYELNFSNVVPSDVTPPTILSESAIVMEAKTGKVIYEKNIHQQYFPASITKIMTAYLALEYGDLDGIVTFSEEAVFSIERNSSHLWMVPEEQITLEQALYGMMLQSANEVSNGIAEFISGSVEDFTKLMNQKAQALEAYQTHFVNPHGLHDEQHYTTAYDMALIAKEAFKNPKFREIIQTPRYEIPPTNKNDIRYLHNQHYMLPNRKTKYLYEGCLGGKTGYTDQARHTLVTYAVKDGMELICVILKSEKPQMYEETTELLNYGFDHFSLIPLAKKNTPSPSIPLKSFDVVKTTLENDVYTVLPKSAKREEIQKMTILPYEIQSSVKKHELLGYIIFSYNNQPIAKANIISQKDYDLSIEERSIGMTPEKEFSSTPSFNIKKIILMVLAIFLLLGGLFSILSVLYAYRPIHKR